MKLDGISELLEEYGISDIDDLRKVLDYNVNFEKDILENDLTEIEKPCTEGNVYLETGVPDCRKLIEIYNKLYSDEFDMGDFKRYVSKETGLGFESVKKYLECQQCNKNYADNLFKIRDGNLKANSYTIKKPFLQNFCKALKYKIDYENLFEQKYESVFQFKKEIQQITKENFETRTEKLEKKVDMEKLEKDRLYDMTQVSTEQLKENLSVKENLIGSDEYKINLALEAFDRRLDDEALMILEMLEDTQKIKQNINYLELYAKLLSNKGENKKSISQLEKLIVIQSQEAHNLLAASIKRDAYNDWKKYDDENRLLEGFKRSRDIYKKVFSIEKKPYPAINIVYLEMMIAYIEEGSNTNSIIYAIEELKNLWKHVKIDLVDYWSNISYIEFLIVTKQYDAATNQIEIMTKKLDPKELSEFKSFAIGRQMKMYQEFCDDKRLTEIIQYFTI